MLAHHDLLIAEQLVDFGVCLAIHSELPRDAVGGHVNFVDEPVLGDAGDIELDCCVVVVRDQPLCG